MRPIATTHDFPNSLRAHAKARRQLIATFTGSAPTSDLEDITSRQFRPIAVTAATNRRRGRSTFVDRVVCVIELRAQEQMVRANTQRRITSVKHALGGWKRPVSEFVRDAMRVRSLSRTAVPDLTVPFIVFPSCPKPARIGLSDLSPEPLVQRGRQRRDGLLWRSHVANYTPLLRGLTL